MNKSIVRDVESCNVGKLADDIRDVSAFISVPRNPETFLYDRAR